MRRAFALITAWLLCAVAHTALADDVTRYTILVPDWRNHVVHQIAPDGTYLGDFLEAARKANPDVAAKQWQSPRGFLVFDDVPGKLWMIAERSLSEWTTGGEYKRSLYFDTMFLEDANCIARAGDKVFVASEDKRMFMAFNLDGSHLRNFGFPELDRAKDCKLGPDGMVYVSSAMRSPQIGLISVWDPNSEGASAKPVRTHILPETGEDGTIWLTSLLFDDAGNLLVTDFSRGRLERWDLKEGKKLAVLLDAGKPGAYGDMVRAPDGRVYMTGNAGLYRFGAGDDAKTLESIQPFFRADSIKGRYEHDFSPAGITFVPRAAAP
jgi:sugar lactone lactonase YvrE